MRWRDGIWFILLVFLIVKVIRTAMKFVAGEYDLRVKLSALAFRYSPRLGGYIYNSFRDLVHSPGLIVIVSLLMWPLWENVFDR